MHWIKETEETLAACDEKLLGKKLKEKKEKSIEIKEKYYGERKIETKELRKLIKKHRNINLIGEKTIEAAKKEIKNLHVKKVQGVPHSMIFTIEKKEPK